MECFGWWWKTDKKEYKVGKESEGKKEKRCMQCKACMHTYWKKENRYTSLVWGRIRSCSLQTKSKKHFN